MTMVRQNQARTRFQINLKRFQKVVMEFKIYIYIQWNFLLTD